MYDESVKVKNPDGTKLLEIYQDRTGPVVKILSDNTHFELSNHLKISAKSIEFIATEGDATLEASDDVIVNGEMIRLNSC